MARRKGNLASAQVGPASLDAVAGKTSIREVGAAVLIAVRARPGAHRDGIEAEREGAWPVSVRAPASEGAANAAVLAVLARAVGRPPSTCSLQRGVRGRDKVVRVEAMNASEARAKLEESVGVA